eukprot:4209696-Pyramimonas_sp.AAC.1
MRWLRVRRVCVAATPTQRRARDSGGKQQRTSCACHGKEQMHRSHAWMPRAELEASPQRPLEEKMHGMAWAGG